MYDPSRSPVNNIFIEKFEIDELEKEIVSLKDSIKGVLKGAEMPKELIWQAQFERTISGKIKRQR